VASVKFLIKDRAGQFAGSFAAVSTAVVVDKLTAMYGIVTIRTR
jgi:hypothetical protein